MAATAFSPTKNPPGGGIPLLVPQEISRIIPSGMNIIGTSYSNSSLPLRTQRNSYNIPEVLTVPYFAPDAISTNYFTVLQRTNMMSANITVTVSIVNNRAQRFTYTQGLNVDTIDVTTDFPVPYPIILEMIKSGDWFVSDFFQQTVGSNFNAQFSAGGFAWGQMTFRGFTGDNACAMTQFKGPFQFQDNIIIGLRHVFINSRRYVAMNMAASAPNPGDDTITTEWNIYMYHSPSDWEGETVSSYSTNPPAALLQGMSK